MNDRTGGSSETIIICRCRALISQLETTKPGEMSREEQLAFWVNIHNALLMHVGLRLSPFLRE